MNGSRWDSASLFPTGQPKAPVKTSWPKYVGENGIKIIRNSLEKCLDSVRPERINSVSGGDETRDF